jgi:hypothetical protein
MELREFVRDTLVEIVKGVVEARPEIVALHGEVNPVGGNFDQPSLAGRQWDFEHGAVEIVAFDVALTSSKTEGGKSGIGVFLGSIGIGGQLSTQASDSQLSRVKFSVPILLPSQSVLRA